jgi:monoamine oxidase
LRAWHFHDWTNDPFSQGAYSYVRPGGIDAHDELAEPIWNTLFFAGEATAGKGANATMEGAILSGVRTTKEAMKA